MADFDERSVTPHSEIEIARVRRDARSNDQRECYRGPAEVMPSIYDHQVCYEVAQVARDRSDAQKRPVQKNAKCVCYTGFAVEMFHLTLHIETELLMKMCAVSALLCFVLASVATV